jgi:DNA-binding SARP family transcriptional activator
VARLELRVLGGFDAFLKGGAGTAVTLPTRKVQAMLAYLALSAGQRHPREKLTSLLWGDLRASPARNNLRQALFALRRALDGVEPEPLRLESDSVMLETAAVEVDALRFQQGIAQTNPTMLEDAVLLYRGDLLAGLRVQSEPFEEWLLAERERLRELALEALARLLTHRRRSGQYESAVHTALRLLAFDPLQEPAHRTLMRLFARLGRRGAALRQYQTCVDALRRELGLEPEARTRRLYRLILRRAAAQDDGRSPVVDGAAVVSHTNGSPVGPPLFGRDGELARLRAVLDAARRAEGRHVAVLGEAGIGKTRLLDELVSDAAREGFLVLLGRAYETERIRPFGPWLDALRDAPLALALENLPATSRADLAPLFSEPVTSRPADEPRSGAAQRLFEAMTALLQKLAACGPVLYVLEDVHWADDTSLRLLSLASRRLRNEPVLIAFSARTEDLEENGSLGLLLEELAGEPRFEAIHLAPLSRDATLALALTLTGGRVDPTTRNRLAERVWTASEGNPFVAIETLRALAADDADVSADLALPERVQALGRRRLGRLTARGRHVVAVAAVIGREFDFALLAGASGFHDREAAVGVEEAVRRGLLRVTGERLEFSHDWLCRVALTDVIRPILRMLHRAVAEAIETLHAGQLAPHALTLGLHFEEAGVWAKALTYFRQAGNQALARTAYREAALAFRRALGALGRLPENASATGESIDLRCELNDTLVPLGDYREALEHLREGERLALAVGDRARLARLLSSICARLRNVGENEEAIDAGLRAADLAASLGDRTLESSIAFRMGQVQLATGDYTEAARLLRHSLETEGTGPSGGRSRWGRVATRASLVRALAGLGVFDEGTAYGEEAVRRAVADADPYALTLAEACLGHLLFVRGDLERAIPLLEHALQLARASDIPDARASASAALGVAYALAGRVAEGLPLLEQVVADDVRRGVAHPSCLMRLGEGYLRAGRLDEAHTRATCALELARTLRERGSVAWANRLLGEIAAGRTPPDRTRAKAHFEDALAVARELGMQPLVAHCHFGLGRLAARGGRGAEDEVHLETASRLFTEMGMTFWLQHVKSMDGAWTSARWEPSRATSAPARPETPPPPTGP